MDKLDHHIKEERPWGAFERFTLNEASTVKLIRVKAGEAFSLQTHAKRDEFWRVVKGSGAIRVGEETHDAKEGDEFFIPKGILHRATGGSEDLIFLEIAFGEFDENDITRLEDRYGRM